MSTQLEALKNSIREILSEIEKEEEDKLKKEVTVTGDVAGYDTPRAFSNNGQHKSGYTKKMASLTGYSAVNENQKAFESLNNEISALRVKEVEEDSNFMIACSKVIGVQKTAKLPAMEKEFHKILLEEVGRKGGHPGPPPGGRPPHGPRHKNVD